MVEPEVFTLSQPEPLSTVAEAPTVAPVGIPVTCSVRLAGAGPLNAWLNDSEAGVTAIVPVATSSVTGTVCAGTFGEVLETLMVPV